MRVVVLAGGLGPERDVSLVSGRLAAQALMQRGHDVVVCDPGGSSAFPELSSLPQSVPVGFPSTEALQEARRNFVDQFFRDSVRERLLSCTVVFNALHGSFGEDGHMAAYLEMLGVPLTGARSSVSMTSWDKRRAIKLVSAAGIRTPRQWAGSQAAGDFPQLKSDRATPWIVKPRSGGSTWGIEWTESGVEAVEAVRRRRDEDLVVEEFLPGREFTVGVLAGRALPAIEIVLKGPLFDYESKYQPGLVDELCPAPLGHTAAEELARAAETAADALGFGDTEYARVDFREDQVGRMAFLEANALPGLSNNSLFPKAAAAAGLPFEELCERLIMMALRRNQSQVVENLDGAL